MKHTFEYAKEKNWPRAKVDHRFTISVPFAVTEDEQYEAGSQVSAMLDLWKKLDDGEITPKELLSKL